MTFCVVVASYTMSYDTSGWALVPGALALVAVGLATGIFNAVLVCVLKLPSIIATLGTFSILEGAALLLRDHPEGPINSGRHRPSHEERQLRSDRLHRRRRRSPFSATRGCTARVRASHSGRSASTRRRRAGSGWRPAASVFLAFVVCSVMASLAGFFLAAQVQIGSPTHRQLRAREHRCRRSRRSEPRGGQRIVRRERCSPRSSSR